MAAFRSLTIGLIGALIVASSPSLSFAQSATPIVTSSCGSQTLTATRNASPYEDTTGKLCTNAASTITGNQSNAGAGTTGATNVPTNSYTYLWNGASWAQGLTGRNADASSLSAALSTEDIAILTGVSPSTASPCASTITVGCTLAAELQLLTNTAAQSIPCEAVSAEQTKATTGNPIATACDLVGKLVTSPYSNRENQTHGTASETGTSAGTIMPASGSASLKEYVTDLTCGNSSATFDWITINDSVSSIFPNPAGNGFSHHFASPLVVAANTAVTFTATTGETTEKCSAGGFNGY